MWTRASYRSRLVYFAAGICIFCGFYYAKDVFHRSFNRLPSGDVGESGQTLDVELIQSTGRHLLTSEVNRDTCTPPAILEFPSYFINNDQRAKGGFLSCVIVAIYMFWAIAIVCDDYFVPALDVICEKMNLQTDVAGATFMALGSSAPELFASMIGVFITEGDIGTGTILGSALFNVLFVVGVCGIFSGQVLQLSWWPMLRDLMSYLLALITLILVIMDNVVMWYEAVIMMCSYSLYLILMYFNPQLERFAYRITNTVKHPHAPEHHLGYTGLAPARDVGDDDTCAEHHHKHGREESTYVGEQRDASEFGEQQEKLVENEDTGGGSNEDGSTLVKQVKSLEMKNDEKLLDIEKGELNITNEDDSTLLMNKEKSSELNSGKNEQSTLLEQGCSDDALKNEKLSTLDNECSSESSSEFDLALGSPLNPPEGKWKKLCWSLALPINICYYLTIPDVRKPSCQKWCPVTFISCIVWIAITSYILIWMVTLIGFTFGVPDTVMGLTLVAFGSSVPDCMSSLFVAKKGDGDMACSHTVGSNVFDILLCLGIPWTIKTTIFATRSSLTLRSHGLFISTFLIMASIVLTFLMMHIHNWKLTKRVGVIYIIVYFIFISIACIIELNVFGYFNPPMCKISASI